MGRMEPSRSRRTSPSRQKEIQEEGLGRNRLRQGLALFVLLTLVGLAAVVIITDPRQLAEAWARIEPVWLLPAAGFFLLDLWFGGWRNHILLRRYYHGVSPWLGVRANLVNMFAAAMTPASTGGGPAQVYTLHRGGVKVVDGISVTALTFVSTQLVFALGAISGFIVIRGRFEQGLITYLLEYSLAVFGLIFLALMLGLWRPVLLGRVLGALARRMARIRPAWERRMHAAVARMLDELERFRGSSRKILASHPLLLVYSLLVNGALYTSRFTAAWFLLRALGVEASYIDVLAIQAVLQFIVYFAPTPGGSGIGEVATVALMSLLAPSWALPLFTFLNRLLIVYLPAVLGSLVFVRVLKREREQQRAVGRQRSR